MNIDLRRVPFSRNGAYLAFSILPECNGRPAGLYLRSVHGGAHSITPGGRVALLEVLADDRTVPFEVRAEPSALYLNTVLGTLTICIADPLTIRVRGEGVGLRLSFDPRLGDYTYPGPDGRVRVNCPSQGMQWMLSALEGAWKFDSPWLTTHAALASAELRPRSDSGVCEGAIEEYNAVWRMRGYEESFEETVAAVAGEFAQWLDMTPSLPNQYSEARKLAAYVNWSSVVEPAGNLLRSSMLMSKNWMNNIWSWDHCFNAMPLVYRKPVMAWDQLMTIFDQQDEYGGLPDCVNDRGLVWNFCKPPIHGWTLNWIMQRTQFIRLDQIRQIYGPMARWTEWWFRYRDDDHDGVPQYNHGNDSGWDNATPFDLGMPLESPDLCAFLVLQMETLARMADALNSGEEAESWQRRAEDLLRSALAHFWQGDHFVALRSSDHMVSDTDSLFLYLPLLLGKRLPVSVRGELISGLMRQGRFLTEHGFATESPASPAYTSDGYWRGPIWAPPTMILVEGLAACGEIDLARSVVRRFCDLCAKNGFAENFDALTGAPLRDGAYTWTSSIFLTLGHEYL